MIITLYNVNERDKDSYLSKLKEIEKTTNFVSNREGNRPKIRIETTDNDISSDEIIEKLENLGFYIFNKEHIAFNLRTGGCIGTIELTLGKNLLIVGNGFDLAHKFKTSYTDFLNCFNVDDTVYINSNSYNMTNNAFYKYLNNIKNKRGYWIDVETAISDIVKYVEKIKKGFIFIEDKTYSSKELNTLFGEERSQFIDIFSPQIYIEGSRCDYKITIESFNTALKKLEYDLDSFTKALEDYLIMIEEQDISSEKIILTDIKNIQEKITHILSFNYTNTFKILYTDDISNEYIDFIHGRLGKHNLVLGISETLPTEEENIELSCIYFKKYFQRIFKKTGAKYADWLDDKNGTNFDTVYIYGHSLDITDKEILSRIINDVDHVKKIVIFYHNETHYRQEISNLVKILDKNTFLKYVAEHRIEFKEQTSYLNL